MKRFHRLPPRVRADDTRCSRGRLGEAIYGEEYELRCINMRIGSQQLLAAIQHARAA